MTKLIREGNLLIFDGHGITKKQCAKVSTIVDILKRNRQWAKIIELRPGKAVFEVLNAEIVDSIVESFHLREPALSLFEVAGTPSMYVTFDTGVTAVHSNGLVSPSQITDGSVRETFGGYSVSSYLGTYQVDLADGYVIDTVMPDDDSRLEITYTENTFTIVSIEGDYYALHITTKQAGKTVKGKWKWNDSMDGPSVTNPSSASTVNENINFISNSESFTSLHIISGAGIPFEMEYRGTITRYPLGGTSGDETLTWAEDGVIAFQTIDFGTEPQTVSNEFYTYLTANAKPIVEGTWDWNESITVDYEGYRGVEIPIDFVSNNIECTYITINGDSLDNDWQMFYGNANETHQVAFYNSIDFLFEWEDQAYRTITFTEPQAVEVAFYDYLVANAAQETAPTTSYTITTNLTNCTGSASNPTEISAGETVTLTFTANTGYKISEQDIAVSGAESRPVVGSDTQIEIEVSNPTGNVTINVDVNLFTVNFTPRYDRLMISNVAFVDANGDEIIANSVGAYDVRKPVQSIKLTFIDEATNISWGTFDGNDKLSSGTYGGTAPAGGTVTQNAPFIADNMLLIVIGQGTYDVDTVPIDGSWKLNGYALPVFPLGKSTTEVPTIIEQPVNFTHNDVVYNKMVYKPLTGSEIESLMYWCLYFVNDTTEYAFTPDGIWNYTYGTPADSTLIQNQTITFDGEQNIDSRLHSFITTFGVQDFAIAYQLSNCEGVAENPLSVTAGGSANLLFIANSGYELPTSIQVTGDLTSYNWNKTTGELQLVNVQGDLTITIEAIVAFNPDTKPTYIVQNGQWVKCEAYQVQNGAWVQISVGKTYELADNEYGQTLVASSYTEETNDYGTTMVL